MIEEKQIIVSDHALVYAFQLGKKSAIPLLFLHGWRSNKEIWYPVVREIAKSSYPVFALDISGFGKSQSPTHPFSVLDFAQITREFLNKLKIKKIHLIGHSFGGRISIKFSSLYPSMVSSLTLVGSAGIREESITRSLLALSAKIMHPIGRLGAMEKMRIHLYQYFGLSDYIATPLLRETYVKVVSEDLTPDIKKIQAATLLYWGKDDQESPLSMGISMEKMIKKSHLITVSGGHFAFLDEKNNFVTELMDHIKRHE